MPPAVRRILYAALCLAAPAATPGCRQQARPILGDVNCHLSSPNAVRGLSRVVFVELEDGSGYPGVAHQVTTELYKSIQARRLFHVDVVWRDDPICRDLPLDKREAYTLEDMAAIREELHCDALLFGRVTSFMPYPRMQMGLYLRLLDLREGRLIWAVDHLWNMTDRIVESRADNFFKHHMRNLYGPADSGLLLMSPSAFQKFVAYEAALTLAPPTQAEQKDEAALVVDRRIRDFNRLFENY